MSSIVNEIKDKITGASVPSGQHLAAILPSKGGPFVVTHRPTPTPGPAELLIEVKAVAVNPIDHFQRDMGFPPLAGYPSVLGSDVAGIVVAAGSAVPSDAPKVGARVAAMAPCFYFKGAPDYGALQERVLVPAVSVVPLPDTMGFTEAALLPMAVTTAWCGWNTIGLPRDTAYTPADKQGLLVWGGASSIGSAAVQVARSMGFSVYVTASERHHAYLKSLGASRVFDYKDAGVVESIIKAAKEDGVTVSVAFAAIRGTVEPCAEVLKALKGEGTAKLACAADFNPPAIDGVEAKFIVGPTEEAAIDEFYHFVWGVWLKEKLATGEFVPSPHVQVVEGGLEGANKALDILKAGVSGTKLVIEV